MGEHGAVEDSSCRLSGGCGRVIQHTITAMAGCFGSADLHVLQRCLEPGDIVLVERDHQVWKVEGEQDRSPAEAPRSWTRSLRSARALAAGSRQAPGADAARSHQLQLERLSAGLQARLHSKHASRVAQQQSARTPTAHLQSLATERADAGVAAPAAERQLPDAPAPDAELVQAFEGSSPSPLASIPLAQEGAEAEQQLETANVDTQEGQLHPGVQEDRVQSLHPALWNLDRIDQRQLPLDQQFLYGPAGYLSSGRGVTLYVLDSGLRASHVEFQAWDGTSTRAASGYDFVDEDEDSEDCEGHGTHTASVAAGRSVGIAKEAKVVGLRILDCSGSGSISNTLAAMDWIAANAQKPAVAIMSLGISVGQWSSSLEATTASLVNEHNVSVVVASGNTNIDACLVAPANVPEALTVSGTDLTTKFDQTAAGDPEVMYRHSNSGPCVDVFAPGQDIYAACGGATRCDVLNDISYAWASGTSMAAPHVAGVAAMYLSDHPQATPAQVKSAILMASSTDRIQDPAMLPGTPNRMLFSNVYQAPLVRASSETRGSMMP